MRTRILFVGLSVALLGLVAWAAFKDSNARGYIAIQQQYLKDYPTSDFNVQVQQLFPSFPQATIEGRYLSRGAMHLVPCPRHRHDRAGAGREAPESKASSSTSRTPSSYQPNTT